MEKQKILIAGMGSVGQRHVRNLRELFGGEVEISAYRVRGLDQVITDDLKIKAGATIQTEYGLTEYFDLNEALENKPDAVFVTNPNSLHMDIALAAARKGCHLFIEKPLSHSLEGIQELKALVENQKLIAFVGYPLRFHPAYSKTKELLNERSIGKLTSVHLEFGEYLPNWHKYEDYRSTYAARSDLGGGVLLTQSHDLDLIYSFFGMPSKVFASGGRSGELEIDVEDNVDVLMEMGESENAFTVHLHQDYLQSPPVRRLEFLGNKGKIVWNYFSQEIECFKDGESKPTVFEFKNFQRNELFLGEIKHFFECIESGRNPVVTLADAEASLRMALAAKASLLSGNSVPL